MSLLPPPLNATDINARVARCKLPPVSLDTSRLSATSDVFAAYMSTFALDEAAAFMALKSPGTTIDGLNIVNEAHLRSLLGLLRLATLCPGIYCEPFPLALNDAESLSADAAGDLLSSGTSSVVGAPVLLFDGRWRDDSRSSSSFSHSGVVGAARDNLRFLTDG